jgi:hypothetical protein
VRDCLEKELWGRFEIQARSGFARLKAAPKKPAGATPLELVVVTLRKFIRFDTISTKMRNSRTSVPYAPRLAPDSRCRAALARILEARMHRYLPLRNVRRVGDGVGFYPRDQVIILLK